MPAPNSSTAWTRLYSDVKISVPGMTDAVFKQELFRCAKDFFDETNIWTEDVPVDIVPNGVIYDITLGGFGVCNRLIVMYDPTMGPYKNWVQNGISMQTPGEIVLVYAPSTAATWHAIIAKNITDPVDAQNYPQIDVTAMWIIDKYRDALYYGTLARVQSQPSKTYSNPKDAARNMQNYIAQRSRRAATPPRPTSSADSVGSSRRATPRSGEGLRLMPIITHKKTSTKAPGTDSTLVMPNDWNDSHNLKAAGGSIYLGRDASGPGDVQEFPVNHAPVGDDMTIYTKTQVDAAIAAAIGALQIGDTGDLCASMAPNKASWVLANGQTIGDVGSAAVFANASAQNLFTLLWGLNGNTWPVQNPDGTSGRGASPGADWIALKKIPVPDARGCVIGMLDLAAGINALLINLGTKVGIDKVSLDITNIPAHQHTIGGPGGFQTGINGGGGVAGGGNAMQQTGNLFHTDNAGGDPAAVPPNSVPLPVPVTQPTIGSNIFIKL